MNSKKIFNRLSQDYDKRVTGFKKSGKNLHIKYIINQILEQTKIPPVSILELGCGTGVNMSILQSFGLKTFGCDHATQMLYQAKNHEPASNYVCAQAEALPFAPNQFDLAFSIDMFQYVDNVDSIIMNMKEVTKDNGLCAILIPNTNSILRMIGRLGRFRGYSLGKEVSGTPMSEHTFSALLKRHFSKWKIYTSRPLPSFTPNVVWNLSKSKPLSRIIKSSFWSLSLLGFGWVEKHE